MLIKIAGLNSGSLYGRSLAHGEFVGVLLGGVDLVEKRLEFWTTLALEVNRGFVANPLLAVKRAAVEVVKIVVFRRDAKLAAL
jgi:hypothetical protein